MREKICPDCKKSKPYTEQYFYKDKSKYSGLKSRCKPCDNRKAAIRQKRSKKHHAFIVKYRREVVTPAIRAFVNEQRKKGCSICGYSKCFDALEFHHINPSEKEKSVPRCASIKQAKREMSKCIVVCANCHREIHTNIRNGVHS